MAYGTVPGNHDRAHRFILVREQDSLFDVLFKVGKVACGDPRSLEWRKRTFTEDVGLNWCEGLQDTIMVDCTSNDEAQVIRAIIAAMIIGDYN